VYHAKHGIFIKSNNKDQKMKKVFKLTLAASSFVVLIGCGGGGGGGISSQSNADNTAAELAQKIRNGFTIIGAATVINSSNN
jgi:hypothetical protein